MIAKLVAHAPTRAEAFDRLAAALRETEVGGVTTNLPFLRWLVSHPVVRAGRATTAFLTEHPPLSRPPARPPAAVWSAPWRLNLPAPPPAPAPDVDATAADHGAAAEQSTRDRADAGHRAEGARRRGRPGRRTPAARRPRGDEDGDAARLAVRRDGARRARRRGRARRRARCSSSSRSSGTTVHDAASERHRPAGPGLPDEPRIVLRHRPSAPEVTPSSCSCVRTRSGASRPRRRRPRSSTSQSRRRSSGTARRRRSSGTSPPRPR